MTAELQKENSRLRVANREARTLLADAVGKLRSVLQDEAIVEETPIEATTAMELAIETIDAVIAQLKTVTLKR